MEDEVAANLFYQMYFTMMKSFIEECEEAESEEAFESLKGTLQTMGEQVGRKLIEKHTYRAFKLHGFDDRKKFFTQTFYKSVFNSSIVSELSGDTFFFTDLNFPILQKFIQADGVVVESQTIVLMYLEYFLGIMKGALVGLGFNIGTYNVHIDHQGDVAIVFSFQIKP
ncbi:hypothetical protein PCE1_003462 [Barthelona sp. PCE]